MVMTPSIHTHCLLASFIDDNIYMLFSWVINIAWITCSEIMDYFYMSLELNLVKLLMVSYPC